MVRIFLLRGVNSERMRLQEIFDKVMEIVFETVGELKSSVNSWIVGPSGGGRLVGLGKRPPRLRIPYGGLLGPTGRQPISKSITMPRNYQHFYTKQVLGPAARFFRRHNDPRDNFRHRPPDYTAWTPGWEPWLNEWWHFFPWLPNNELGN